MQWNRLDADDYPDHTTREVIDGEPKTRSCRRPRRRRPKPRPAWNASSERRSTRCRQGRGSGATALMKPGAAADGAAPDVAGRGVRVYPGERRHDTPTRPPRLRRRPETTPAGLGGQGPTGTAFSVAQCLSSACSGILRCVSASFRQSVRSSLVQPSKASGDRGRPFPRSAPVRSDLMIRPMTRSSRPVAPADSDPQEASRRLRIGIVAS